MKKRKIFGKIIKSAMESGEKAFEKETDKKINKQKMDNPNTNSAEEADNIIRNHVMWSMGAGLIPVLVADVFAVSALQLDMIRQMCKAYNVDFQETQGKAIVTSLTSTTLARIGAGSVVKLIPGIGTMLGGITVSVFAGASTYALGEVFKKHFESGGTILDFDPDRLRKHYKEKFEKGKKVARDLKSEAKVTTVEADEIEEIVETEAIEVSTEKVEDNKEDVISKLKKLGDLKEAGVITKAEFDKMKKKLIEGF